MTPIATSGRRIASAGRAVLVAAFATLAAAPALAQTATDGFAGFSSRSNEPIDIESDTLEVRDAEKTAVFRGNVKAVQGKMTLRSRELKVDYANSGGAGAAGSEITKITAHGRVLITTEQRQTATSDWATFDVKGQMVTIGGNVVLSQGENVIKGDRLVIDLKTGRSRFEHEGRVRGLFMPRSFEQNGTDGRAGPAAPAPAGQAPPPG